jgi:hypothetical protein
MPPQYSTVLNKSKQKIILCWSISFSAIDFIDELLKFWSKKSILFNEQNFLLNKISYFSENDIEKIKYTYLWGSSEYVSSSGIG